MSAHPRSTSFLTHRQYLHAALLVAGGCLAGASQAQEFYAGGTAGFSRLDLDCGHTTSCNRQGNTYKLFAGYMHTPYLGAEAAYYNHGTSQVTASSPSPGQLVGDLSGSGFGVYGIAVAPFDEFSLHVKVGMFSSRTRLDAPPSAAASESGTERHSAFAWSFGGGYAFSPHIGARVDFERLQVKFRGETNHLDMVTAGLVYRF